MFRDNITTIGIGFSPHKVYDYCYVINYGEKPDVTEYESEEEEEESETEEPEDFENKHSTNINQLLKINDESSDMPSINVINNLDIFYGLKLIFDGLESNNTTLVKVQETPQDVKHLTSSQIEKLESEKDMIAQEEAILADLEREKSQEVRAQLDIEQQILDETSTSSIIFYFFLFE